MTNKLLQFINNISRRLLHFSKRNTGSGGWTTYAAAAVVTGVELDSIVMGNTAGVFSVYEEDNIDVLASRAGSLAVAAGQYCPAPEGKVITAVTCDKQWTGYHKAD